MIITSDKHTMITSERYDMHAVVAEHQFHEGEWTLSGHLGKVWIYGGTVKKFSSKEHAIDAAQGWLSMMELALSTAGISGNFVYTAKEI